MAPSYDHQAPKRPANLNINADLLAKARDLKINLSDTLQQALVGVLRQRQRKQWLTENRGAIDADNQQVEAHGVFSDGLRSFDAPCSWVTGTPTPGPERRIPT